MECPYDEKVEEWEGRLKEVEAYANRIDRALGELEARTEKMGKPPKRRLRGDFSSSEWARQVKDAGNTLYYGIPVCGLSPEELMVVLNRAVKRLHENNIFF